MDDAGIRALCAAVLVQAARDYESLQNGKDPGWSKRGMEYEAQELRQEFMDGSMDVFVGILADTSGAELYESMEERYGGGKPGAGTAGARTA